MMTRPHGLIVSVSGVRGIIGESINPEVAMAYASALGAHLRGGSVVIGRDGRPSGHLLRHAVLAGLNGSGCEVHDLGVVSTPTVGLAIRHLKCSGGIQITASHNPAQWNGLKLFGPNGQVLDPRSGLQVQQLFESNIRRWVQHQEVGKVHSFSLAEQIHGDLVLDFVDGERIRAARFRAFLDGNGGAGGPLGRRLLQSLAVETQAHNCEADGIFRHEPEPTVENLQDVCPLVRKCGVDIGMVLDPDSDRLALLDEQGNYIGEEFTLALAVQSRLRKQPGPVVINMSTSRMVEDIAAQHKVPCYRSAVGEANVVARMHEVQAIIGGEGNGGVIDPRVGYVRDPFIGMALILNLMADTKKKLSELVADLPNYHIVKEKYEVDREKLPETFDKLSKIWKDVRISQLDGMRLDWTDRWVHLRSSNTEPIVRVIAEAPKLQEAQSLCSQVGKLLQKA